MAVRYDTDDDEFVIDSDNCEDCDEPLYDTGCDAPGCPGRCCMDCATGCDLESMPETGRCATATAEESEEDYDARCNAERVAWGL